MKITVLTLFPEMFDPVTEHSILGRAGEKGILDIKTVNIRDYAVDKHNRVDDTPFGGGAGMVMMTDPIFRALEGAGCEAHSRILYMSPRGRQLDQAYIEELADEEQITILCGHYEGVDQRVMDHWQMEEVTIGDYILTGGELPAMVLIDAVARFVPQVLGSSESHFEESIYSGLLEYPHYTKPREYQGLQVPDILLSGDHRKIHLWRLRESLLLTKKRRPDLYECFLKERSQDLAKDEKKVLAEVESQE